MTMIDSFSKIPALNYCAVHFSKSICLFRGNGNSRSRQINEKYQKSQMYLVFN